MDDVFEACITYKVLKREFKMRVAVCDDERDQRSRIMKAIYDYSNEHHLEIVIEEFESGDTLLGASGGYDLIMLDYQMDGINGLETARELRAKNVNSTIIFLTGFPHFMKKAFEVSPFRFMEKPLDVAELYKVLDDYFKEHGNNYPILLKENRDTVLVRTGEIIYLEADNKKCYVTLDGKKLHCAKTMGAVFSLVPRTIFFKVNKAFVVNFNHIDKYDTENIYMKTGDIVPLSRKYRMAFKNAYRLFARGRFL